jgi:hypothetical protein
MLVTDPKFHEKSRQRPQVLGTGYVLKQQQAIVLKMEHMQREHCSFIKGENKCYKKMKFLASDYQLRN